jgi:hypothetical protein
MSKWIASILALCLLLPGSALAATDPTNDPEIERQIYSAVLDVYAPRGRLCVVQKPEDFGANIRKPGVRELILGSADWHGQHDGAAEMRAELGVVRKDFAALIANMASPITGHHIGPDLLPAEMSLVDALEDCSNTLVLSAPALSDSTAFIDVNYRCALCGHGYSYALRQHAGRWRVVATWLVWIS